MQRLPNREIQVPPRVEPAGRSAAAVLSRALAFFDAAGEPFPEPTFRLADFQQAALVSARTILEMRGGVLVADGVGLGKTFVALALIEDELRRGGRVLVTSPAALRRHWQLPLLRLARKHQCSTSGLQRDSRPARFGRPHLEWVSHTRLSRGWKSDELSVPQSLTVVDEAHGCRNPATRRYRSLAAICAPGRVALLTATPVCNSLSDLYFLIRLFAADSAFHDRGVMDLRLVLRAERPEMDRVRAVLAAVMVRRTRAELAMTGRELRLPDGRSFPGMGPPAVIRYPGGTRVLESLHLIEELRFPAFALGSQGGIGAGTHGGELLRCMLLKRLESSVAAARSSVFRLTRFMMAFADALASGRLLTARDFRQLVSPESGIEQLILQPIVLVKVSRGLDRRRLDRDCRRELRLLSDLAASLEDATDGKLSALKGQLACAPGVIVFTEFQETARVLWSSLLRDGKRVARIDGSGAWLGAQRSTRAGVIARFAPHANGCRAPHERERVDILIATDLLSEGLNLQDAHTVLSYDLPWNPTRLMQRVGRIDRLGSPHASITAGVFMPGDHLEAILGLVRRIRGKLRVIDESVGTETSPLEPTWIPNATAIEALRDGSMGTGGDVILRSAPTSVDPISVLGECKARSPEPGALEIATAECGETRTGVLLLGTMGRLRAACFYDVTTTLLNSPGTAEMRSLLTNCRPGRHRADQTLVDAAVEKAAGTCAAVPAAGSTAMRAARLVLRAVARAGGRLDRPMLERAEALLRRLRMGMPLGTELDLRALLRAPPVDAGVLITALEGVVPAGPSSREENRFRPLIAIEFRPSARAGAGPAGATSG